MYHCLFVLCVNYVKFSFVGFFSTSKYLEPVSKQSDIGSGSVRISPNLSFIALSGLSAHP